MINRHLILIIIFSLCEISLGQEYIQLDNRKVLSGKALNTMPVRTIEEMDDGIYVKYHFDYVTKYIDNSLPYSSILSFDGFAVNTTLGKPVIPMHTDTFTIPMEGSFSVALIDSSFIEIPIELAPVRIPLKNNDTYSKEVIPIKPYIGYYPAAILSTQTSKYRTHPILDICLSPIQYNYEEKKVRIFKDFTYCIKYDKGKSIQNKETNSILDYDPFFENIILNPTNSIKHRASSNTSAIPIATPRYLIISVPKYNTAVNKFAEWKKTQGFHVDILSQSTWDTSTILSTIKSENQQSAISYLLIIGDHNDVPGELYNNDSINLGSLGGINFVYICNYVSDYHYGLPDPCTGVAEIKKGRLSVSTSSEALNVVNKIIKYEKEPTTNYSFYQTGINCAFFEDANNDSIEDRRFTLTSEDVRNYLIDKGKTVNRIYYTDPSKTPLYWSQSLGYSIKTMIPAELRKPTFMWDGSANDISSKINQGAFYVLFRDHGDSISWGHPPFTINDINQLSNGNKLPVVFSMACSTGAFDTGTCFAEAFLRKSNGGCSAIIAASNEIFTEYGDALAKGMFHCIWPSPGLITKFPNNINVAHDLKTPVYRIGDLLELGLYGIRWFLKINPLTLYTYRILHCFGDPTMEIYTDYPEPFEDVSILEDGNNFVVNVGENATITFYNTANGSVESFYGSHVEYPADNNIRICISNHNKIPYIFEPLFIQNETINTSKIYQNDIIKVGSNVTTTKPSGEVRIKNGKTIMIGNTVELNGKTTVMQGAELEIRNNN